MSAVLDDARRVPALDGLRGVAVVGVLAFHAGLLGGGFLGVSSFFTLSGFLITRMLLAEVEQTDGVDLRRFWARRARRLLPAAVVCAFAAVLFAATIGSRSQVVQLRGDMLAALAQVANWRFLGLGRDYASRFSDPSPLQHYWSLAIEEQFYVALPLALAWMARRNRRRFRFTTEDRRRPVVRAALVVGGACAVLGAVVTPRHAYYDTLTRLPELLVGVALAAWLGRDVGLRRGHPWVPRVARLAPVALVVGAALWWKASPTAGWLFRGGLLLNALATASVIVACHVPGGWTQLLRLRPLAWLGRVSYGIYLYHWPVFLWLTPTRTGRSGLPLLALRLAVTLALAHLSWAYLEHPVRHRQLLRGPGVRYAAVAAAALVAANVALVTTRAPDAAVAFPSVRGEGPASGPAPVRPDASPTTAAEPDSSPAPEPSAATPVPLPTTTTTTAPPPPVRVMVVGDSIALTLAGGMLNDPREHPDWRIYVDAESGCSLGTGGRLRALGYEAEDPPKCALRNAALAAHVQAFRPDVVLVLSCLWEVADRELPDDHRWRSPGDPAFDEFERRAASDTADVLAGTGARVGWMTCPHLDPDYHPEYFMGPPPYPVADPARVAGYNGLLAGVLADKPVTMLDLAGYLSALPGGDLDRGRRPDGVHLSKPVAHDIGVWAVGQLAPGR